MLQQCRGLKTSLQRGAAESPWWPAAARARPLSLSCAGAAGASSSMQQELPESLRGFRPNVGVCVVNSSGQVFAATRTDDTARTWQMPQGGIDTGEKAEAAALRELFEETSMSSVRVVGAIDRWLPYEFPTEVRCKLTGSWKDFRGQAQKWYLLHFYGDDTEINLDTAHKEFSSWRWMELGTLPDAVIHFKRGVYEEVVQEFEPQIARLLETGFKSNHNCL